MADVDPKVYALAAAFVDDELRVLGDGIELDPHMQARRAALIERAAQAMQQAIEDECTEIRRELTA